MKGNEEDGASDAPLKILADTYLGTYLVVLLRKKQIRLFR